MAAPENSSNEIYIWPALLDVIIATLMIVLLFMIIQYISFFLSDALKRIELRDRQTELAQMFAQAETEQRIPKGSIAIETTGDFQKIRFSSALVFPSGRADIPEDQVQSFQFLDTIGGLLKTAYYEKELFEQIFIEGHTDTTPINTDRYHSNWELSTARALYIAKYFIEKGDIKPQYSKKRFLGISGYGEYNFIWSKDRKDENRRIEILLVYALRGVE